MISRLFPRPALHEHAEPTQRILGMAELAPDSDELARLLATDPVPEVRAAAAQRCNDLAALAVAWEAESDSTVRAAVATALAGAVSATPDQATALALLESDRCTDAIRGEVAQRTQDPERRRSAVAAIRDEPPLVELALVAPLAETRLAAAQRVCSPDSLRHLADAAKNRDHGVARLARQRLDVLAERREQDATADGILAELEALAEKPGPILSAVIELNRRWQALDMSGDDARRARCDAAQRALFARFEREQDEQRARLRFERALREWAGRQEPPSEPDACARMRAELAELSGEAQKYGDGPALAMLDDAGRRVARWEAERLAQADAEVLVVEAEQLAAGTSIDHAKLPERWQALELAIRTPGLTRRFEAALMAIEHRRLAQIRVAQQEASAVRQQVHDLLHRAEQALAAGQLQPARAAADEIRSRKAGAGALPRPTVQRLSRLVQQLGELERWAAFGQHHARIQLCERAEATATQTLGASQVAHEVRKLRDEWKALDQQHAGVPRTLWERFDRACEKAYAPAARHFAELAAQRKQAKQLREEFIAAAVAHAPTLLAEPRDWRAIEGWLRETDRAWRANELANVEPRARKALDARLNTALAPLRDALAAVRDQAKAGRQALIGEAEALVAKAVERDAPSQVKALQARWQAQAKSLALPQRDERLLWEQFRAACNAVFDVRESKRKEEDGRRHDGRRALEGICAQLEQLALATDKDDQDVRRVLRELRQQWKKPADGFDRALRGIESRFRSATAAVEAALSARERSRAAAVWRALSSKERVCEELDGIVCSGAGSGSGAAESATAAANVVNDRWTALPALPAAWEKRMLVRRNAALSALAGTADAADYRTRIEAGAGSRREMLLELEMLLGLESPAELQAFRLALQVKQLRERFQSATAAGAASADDRLLAWCSAPGVADDRDRQRCERIIAAIECGR